TAGRTARLAISTRKSTTRGGNKRRFFRARAPALGWSPSRRDGIASGCRFLSGGLGGRLDADFFVGFSGAAEVDGRVHQGDVGKGLREIADEALFSHIVFLGKQANVVGQINEPREELFGFVAAAHHDVVIREPEAASQKDALARGEAVPDPLRVVPEYEAPAEQFLFDGSDRAHDARIGGGKETSLRGHEQAGVQFL